MSVGSVATKAGHEKNNTSYHIVRVTISPSLAQGGAVQPVVPVSQQPASKSSVMCVVFGPGATHPITRLGCSESTSTRPVGGRSSVMDASCSRLFLGVGGSPPPPWMMRAGVDGPCTCVYIKYRCCSAGSPEHIFLLVASHQKFSCGAGRCSGPFSRRCSALVWRQSPPFRRRFLLIRLPGSDIDRRCVEMRCVDQDLVAIR
ncbi:hypothetical protein J3F83DRAFT_709739 [Trichoderma novae-zelandiae]